MIAIRTRPVVAGLHGAVTSAHPLASQAGLDVLRSGGNVVAAIVAATGIGLGGTALADVEQGDIATQAHAEAVAPGTPCAVSARACVDLDTQRAWLLRDGKVTRGPVPIASGGAGQETPLGHSFRVYRKNKDHVSGEFTGPDGNPAPMPWSVFFAPGGIAFHEGNTETESAGCVRLSRANAERWFNSLQVGDRVEVTNIPQ
mgnify:CR=1 FL=1